jgi:hypothetical protein
VRGEVALQPHNCTRLGHIPFQAHSGTCGITQWDVPTQEDDCEQVEGDMHKWVAWTAFAKILWIHARINLVT